MIDVTVLILTYNAEKYIKQTIDSVLSQNYKNIQVVIGDDASKDLTRSIIDRCEFNSEVIFTKLYHPNNVGITKNFNDCLDVCKGEFIFLLGGDDLFLPGKIEKQVEFMKNNTHLTISYHDVDVFDSTTNQSLYLYNRDRHGFFRGASKQLVRQGTFNCGCATAIRASKIPKCNESIKYSSDWLWYIDLLEANHGQIGFFPGVYARYRRHENNITSTSPVKVQLKEVENTLAIITIKYPWLKDDANVARSERLFVYGIKSIFHAEYVFGFSLLKKAFTINYLCLFYVIKRRLRMSI